MTPQAALNVIEEVRLKITGFSGAQGDDFREAVLVLQALIDSKPEVP